MEARPKIKIEKRPQDLFIEFLTWTLLISLWIYVLYIYNKLPDRIPNHYDSDGNVIDYMSKNFVFFMPALITFLVPLLAIITNYPSSFNFPVKITPDNAIKQYTLAIRMIRVLNLMLVIIFGTITYAIITPGSINLWAVIVAPVTVFIPLVYYIRESFKNK